MPKEITIELTSAVVGHTGTHSSITLREPTAREAFAIGELSVITRTDAGDLIYLPRDDAYARYLEACIVKPSGADGATAVAQLSLADSFRVREAIDGFFADARRLAFPPSPPSSSGSDGPISAASAD